MNDRQSSYQTQQNQPDSAVKKSKNNYFLSGLFTGILLCVISGILFRYSAYSLGKYIFFQKNYTLSEHVFEILNFKDTDVFLQACQAGKKYELAEEFDEFGTLYLKDAYYAANSLDLSDLPYEEMSHIHQMFRPCNLRYNRYDEKSCIHKISIYEEKLPHSEPFIGMSELRIHDTRLGQAYSITDEHYRQNGGKRCWSRVYNFGSSDVITHKVKCADGVVESVEELPQPIKRPSATPRYTYNPHSLHTPIPQDDPYNVYEYENEEDFYDEHYDDFLDYYDAEDYYNEHHY